MECHGYNINPNAQWTARVVYQSHATSKLAVNCWHSVPRTSLPLMNPNALWAVGNYFIGL